MRGLVVIPRNDLASWEMDCWSWDYFACAGATVRTELAFTVGDILERAGLRIADFWSRYDGDVNRARLELAATQSNAKRGRG